MSYLIGRVGEFVARGVGFRSNTEQIDTTTSCGMLVFNIFGSLAQREQDLIRDRANAALKAAREQGSRGGRRRVMTTDRQTEVRPQAHRGRADHPRSRQPVQDWENGAIQGTRRYNSKNKKHDVLSSFVSGVRRCCFRAVIPTTTCSRTALYAIDYPASSSHNPRRPIRPLGGDNTRARGSRIRQTTGHTFDFRLMTSAATDKDACLTNVMVVDDIDNRSGSATPHRWN